MSPAELGTYLNSHAPAVFDPFSGGGTIPLEAQRLGLPSIAQDLNPIPVLITSVLTDLPSRFMGRPPVHSESATMFGKSGLADDVRSYGQILVEQARAAMGRHYEHPERTGTVLAWLWARTVPSPDPAMRGARVPLLSSYWLQNKKGQQVWLSPNVDHASRSWSFDVVSGQAPEPNGIARGTKVSNKSFRCLLTGTPIPTSYVQEQGKAGNIGAELVAVVGTAGGSKFFEAATDAHTRLASDLPEHFVPDTSLPSKALGFRVQQYGLTKHRDLFTPRQLAMLGSLVEVVQALHDRVERDAQQTGLADDGASAESGGEGARAYADTVVLCLAFAVSKLVDYHCSLVRWYPEEARTSHLFTKQAVPMAWHFVENNPLASIGGSLIRNIELIARYLDTSCAHLRHRVSSVVRQASVMSDIRLDENSVVVSTDPPYYDNVPYADLSDLFYVWLRPMLRRSFPELMRTLLVPKDEELIAEPARTGSSATAEAFFLSGMRSVMSNLASTASRTAPLTIYYAFKQTKAKSDGLSSTGWETFLAAVIQSGLAITGTWPIRTERKGRSRGQGSNALATSVVLVCRQRSDHAVQVTRGDFRRLLREELPSAVEVLERTNIAPVDMAQAAVGPGMAMFSQCAAVLEHDGSTMTVRAALQLINEVVDEVRGEDEADLDRETRFAITWFSTRGFEKGPFGEAETLATARNVSVVAVEQAGLLKCASGKVRLLTRVEMPDDWDPTTDRTPTVWECTQHLIKRLESDGEAGAAALLARLGTKAEHARTLAYRLYTTCERKKWADEARAYNGLVVAWPELERLAAETTRTATRPEQVGLFEER